MIESKGAKPIQPATGFKPATVITEPKKKKSPKINPATKNVKLFLAHKESAQLAANHAKHEIIKQERKLLELRKLLIDSQENTLKRDKIILNNDINNINTTDRIFKEENELFLNNITKKYKELKDGNWGYNSQTGEIIIKD